MTPQQIQAIVDELFTLLEAQTTNTWLLSLLKGLQAIADKLIPQIASNLATKEQTLHPFPHPGPHPGPGPHPFPRPYPTPSPYNNPVVTQALALGVPYATIVSILATGGVAALEQYIASLA